MSRFLFCYKEQNNWIPGMYACTRNSSSSSSRRYTIRIFNLVKHNYDVNRLNFLFLYDTFLVFNNFTSLQSTIIIMHIIKVAVLAAILCKQVHRRKRQVTKNSLI